VARGHMDTGGYDYINAKLHAMRSRLYEAERLEELLKSRDLFDLLETLQPARGEHFPETSEVERSLASAYFRTLDEIADALPGKAHVVFNALALRGPLENLKVLFKFWDLKTRGKEPPAPVETFLLTTPRTGLLDVEGLLAAIDIEGFIAGIGDHDLARIAAEPLQRYEPGAGIFPILVSLDAGYYLNIWKEVAHLSAEDRQAARRVIGTEIDISNILWAARLRLRYGLEPAEVERCLCPAGLKLSASDRARICRGENAEDIAARAGKNFAELLEGRDVLESERLLWSHLYLTANHEFYNSFFTIGVSLGFYVLKRVEMMNLATVMEGFKYELAPHDIRDKLIPVAAF